MCQVPPGTSVCDWPALLAPGGFPCCVREGSMSVTERTTYRRSLGSNALAFDELRRDPQHAPYTSGPSTDFSVDDSIPLLEFLSDLQDQPDPREILRLWRQASGQNVLARVRGWWTSGFSAFAILVAVFNSDVTRVLIDKARATMGGATTGQSATQAALNPPAVRQILLEVPARVSDPVTPGERQCGRRAAIGNSEPARISQTTIAPAQQSQAPAARTGNEAAAPSEKTPRRRNVGSADDTRQEPAGARRHRRGKIGA